MPDRTPPSGGRWSVAPMVTCIIDRMTSHRVASSNRLRAGMAALAMAVLAGVGCTGTMPPGGQASLKVSVEQVDALRRYEYGYRLQPGDVLEVFVYRHQELSRKVVVRPDGLVSLPLLGDVKAAGQAPQDLARQLTGLLSQRLRDPEVTVLVENPPEPMVYVVGAVGIPRALPLRSARTLAQALAQSGDLSKNAAVDAVSVLRLNDEGVLEMHLAQVQGEPRRLVSQPELYMVMNTMPLKPNDLVVVPESLRSQMLRGFTDVNTVISPFLNLWILREVTR
jgi:polysaccharide biosynthesis/export protein